MNATRRYGIFWAVLMILFVSGTGLAVPTLPPALPKNPGDAAIRKALAAILADIAKQRDALVKIQRELVRRPGIAPENGGDGEEDKARWIEEWLAAEGLSPPERVDCPDNRVRSGIRPNLILRQPNPFANQPTLWVIAYLDNSPPGDIETWIASPLSLRVDGDSMFGLGVQDNNNAIAAALLLVRSLHKQQAVPPLNFGVLFVSGEKTGSHFGFLHLIEKRPHLFKESDHFLVPSYGSEQGDLIEIGEKGILWLKVSVRGIAGHSALPETGKNALAAGAEMIASLPRLLERFPATDSLFEQPTCTFTPTRPIAVESAPNQIPAFFGFNLDARILPNYQPEEIQAAVEEIAEDIAKKICPRRRR